MNILLCDDERDILRMSELLLAPRGHTLELAQNSADGKELFDTAIESGKTYDLIITDLNMPGDSGFSLSGYVRGRGYEGRIAMMTSGEAEASNLASVKAEYWFKPTAMTKLVDLVEAGTEESDAA